MAISAMVSMSWKTPIINDGNRENRGKRTDDNKLTAIKRFQTYEKSSLPVIDYYKQSNLLKVVDGEGSIIEINDEISGLIEGI